MRAGAPDLTALAAAQPHVAFDNVVSRFRDRKSNTTFIVAGAEAYSDAQSRGSVRSAFDGDVLTAPDILVSAAGKSRSWEGSLGGCSPRPCTLARFECPVLMLAAAAGERAGLHLPAVRRQCRAGRRGLGAAPNCHDGSAVQPVNVAYRSVLPAVLSILLLTPCAPLQPCLSCSSRHMACRAWHTASTRSSLHTQMASATVSC
jgi:hypothetical protein